jgi:exocyst complex component 2
LDKTLGILVEGLIDTFLSLFHENKSKDLRSLDANGFCQLMLEVKHSFFPNGKFLDPATFS